MSEQPRKDGTKGRAQDVLGLALCAIGGFGAVSVLMQVLGNTEGKKSWLALFRGVQDLLGGVPAFALMGGMAALGCVLFLRTEKVDAGRHLLGLVGVVLGAALLLGGASVGAGGTIGGALTDALGASWLGGFLSILLGLAIVVVSAYVSWGERLSPVLGPGLAPLVERLRASRAGRASATEPRTAPSDRATPDVEGVTADEAAALVPEAPTAPPRRREPFRAPVSAPASAAGSAAGSAPAEPAPGEALAAAAAPRSAPAPEPHAEPTPAPGAPRSASIEDIAKALNRAARGTSRNVPDNLRGPNVEDDVRVRGGVPEGAMPLNTGLEAPVSARFEPEPEPEPEREREREHAAESDPQAPAPALEPAEQPPVAEATRAPASVPDDDAADPEAPAPDAPVADEPPAPDKLLAELRAANERLKVVEEAASRENAPRPVSPERPQGYWARSGGAEVPEAPVPRGGPAPSWEGNTWRPSWEAPAPDELAPAAPAGPRMSWERDEEDDEPLAAVPLSSASDELEDEDDETTVTVARAATEPAVDDDTAEDEDEEEDLEDDELYDAEDDEESEYEDEEEDDEARAEDDAEDDEEEWDDEEWEEDEEGEEAAYDEEDEDEYDEEADEEADEDAEAEVYAEDEDEADDTDEEAWDESEDDDAEAPAPAAVHQELVPEADTEDGPAAAPGAAKADKGRAKAKGKRAAAQQAGLFGEEGAEAADVVLEPQVAPARATGKGRGRKAAAVAETPAAGGGSDLVVPPRVYEAGCMFLDENRVAVSMLQRRYGMDFDEACGILDTLQEMGLIGPYLGGKTRDILLGRDEWEALARGATQV